MNKFLQAIGIVAFFAVAYAAVMLFGPLGFVVLVVVAMAVILFVDYRRDQAKKERAKELLRKIDSVQKPSLKHEMTQEQAAARWSKISISDTEFYAAENITDDLTWYQDFKGALRHSIKKLREAPNVAEAEDCLVLEGLRKLLEDPEISFTFSDHYEDAEHECLRIVKRNVDNVHLSKHLAAAEHLHCYAVLSGESVRDVESRLNLDAFALKQKKSNNEKYQDLVKLFPEKVLKWTNTKV